jgi:general secretion pathway protein A
LAFGIGRQASEAEEYYRLFLEFLTQEYARNRQVVLVLDDAQNLDIRELEEVRLLSNAQVGRVQPLQVILLGHPELRATLARPELRQLSQRVVAHYELKPLTEDETIAYIRYRLERAGGRPDLFSDNAIRRIYVETKGVPRLINLLCGAALLYAFADDLQKVEADLVEAVLHEGAAGLCMGVKRTEGLVVATGGTADAASISDGKPVTPLLSAVGERPPRGFSIDDARQLFGHVRKVQS